jgi:ribosomal protein S25
MASDPSATLARAVRERTGRLIRTAAPQRLVEELFASPFITVNRAADVMAVSFKFAGEIVARLAGAGMVREITGQKRNRIDCADEILRLLDKPLTDAAP